jgi:hypothetical protein
LKHFKHFIIKNLALTREELEIVHEAAKYDTYIETVSNKADTIHRKIKQEYPETLEVSYSKYVTKLVRKQRLGLVDLICDITTEDFYGEVQGFHIHGWTGKDGVQGKFHYLVVGILFRNKMIPFYGMIVRLGRSKAEMIGRALQYCHSIGLKISKILFNRGFYIGELIDKLKMEKVNYLIFVPKRQLFKCMLEGTEKSVVIEHEIPYNLNKSRCYAETNIALVKDVLGYDWVFATDLSMRSIARYVAVYRRRWNIETMFRVHDEARIKTKSTVPVVRLFYFLISLLLVALWNIFQKQKMTFKLFVISLLVVGKNVAINKKA